MTVGQQRGPNAFGFPFSYYVCGAYTIRVIKPDGDGDTPVSEQTLSVFQPWNGELSFFGNGHGMLINVTVPPIDQYTIAGAIVGPDGTVKQRLTLPRRIPMTDNYTTLNFNPVIDSNGSGYLVAYESLKQTVATNLERFVVIESFEGAGNLISNSNHSLGAVPNDDERTLDTALVWMGNRYRLALKGRDVPTLYIRDFDANGTPMNNYVPVAFDAFANSIATGTDSTPSLAWNPLSGAWTLTYIRRSICAVATCWATSRSAPTSGVAPSTRPTRVW